MYKIEYRTNKEEKWFNAAGHFDNAGIFENLEEAKDRVYELNCDNEEEFRFVKC